MKKTILISILICLIFSCSKTDVSLKEDCTCYAETLEPEVCNGTLSQNDTCQTYLGIWKDLLLSRNQMTQDYFNNHITPCNTSIDKWNDVISFWISYKVKIEWSEVLLWDQFIIWLSPSTSGQYPSLTLPRNSLLTKNQINSAANIMAFSSRINTISSINKLKYHSLNDAMKVIVRSSGVDKFCTCEIFYEHPHMVIPPIGHPFLRSYGVLNWDENKCITCQMNLYTGEIKVSNNPCMIYFCVAEGTQITVNNNSFKTIEKIKIGDTILSVNTKLMTIEEDFVQKINSITHKDIIEIKFSDLTRLSSTYDHPYFVKGKGWCSYKPSETQKKLNIKTKQLQTGDICFKYIDNKLIEVQIEKIAENTGEVMTYNISKLAKNKSYFANGILVSNEEN
jgi:hypothetical protein